MGSLNPFLDSGHPFIINVHVIEVRAHGRFSFFSLYVNAHYTDLTNLSL